MAGNESLSNLKKGLTKYHHSLVVSDEVGQHDDVIVNEIGNDPKQDIVESCAEPLFEAEKPEEEHKTAEKVGFNLINETEDQLDNEANTSLYEELVTLVDTYASAVLDLEEPGAEYNVPSYAKQQPPQCIHVS